MKFGIVADDRQGASDAAGMLTERGIRTVLFLQTPDPQTLSRLAGAYDAGVIATQARSIDPEEARRRTEAAVGALADAGVERIQIKYSSTFDSTPEGNIGQTLDAAVDRLGVAGTIVCPALPVNGRTTYCGHHFVNGELLSDSPVRNHPLNPMTDSNLARWLGTQTGRRVASVRLPVVRQGADALREHLDKALARGEAYLVTDAIEESDLATIARATSDWGLTSGGSGITAHLGEALFPGRAPLDFRERLAACRSAVLAVAGSCMPQTRRQNAFAEENGFTVFRLDGLAVLAGEADVGRIAEQAAGLLAQGKDVLVASSGDPDEVRGVQEYGRSIGLDVPAAGERVANALSDVAGRLVEAGAIARLVISGGETSNAVCRRLGVRALEVGLPIDPGVPYCFPLERDALVTVLKSGNFGADDLYTRMRRLQ